MSGAHKPWIPFTLSEIQEGIPSGKTLPQAVQFTLSCEQWIGRLPPDEKPATSVLNA
jgi:hypothetical protein